MALWGKDLSNKHKNCRQEGAQYALQLLTVINLLLYADQYVPSAVKSGIQESLHLSDFETALPNAGMLLHSSYFDIYYIYRVNRCVYDIFSYFWLDE